MNRRPTYAALFAFLESVGFEVCIREGEKGYIHCPTNTILLFSSADSRSDVSAADLLSVEVRLGQNGVINQPVSQLIHEFMKVRD
jgi:hypothetical protein